MLSRANSARPGIPSFGLLIAFIALLLQGCPSMIEPAPPAEESRNDDLFKTTSTASASIAPLIETGERQYLIFQLNNVPLKEVSTQLAELKQVLGPNRSGATRLYGFGMLPPMLLAHSVDELKAIVEKGFDLAIEHDLPVYFQIDDMNNFPTDAKGPELKFHEDPTMCEWINFPSQGATHGGVPRLWINWGAPFSAPAIPCLASPRLRGFAISQLRRGVLEPLKDRLVQLHAQNKDYLFAGICIGWETHIPDYTPGRPLLFIDPAKPPVDRFAVSPITMQSWEMRQTGYAALHHLGYDATRLAAEAEASQISPDELLRRRCHGVIQNYSALLAREARDAGLPIERIFTHMLAIDSVRDSDSTAVPPIWAAVNPDSIPGFTMCQASGAIYDVTRLKERIALAQSSIAGEPDDPARVRFAVAEGYIRCGPSQAEMRAYLGETLGNGAILLNIFGWSDGTGSPYHIPRERAGGMAALCDWLEKGIAPPGEAGVDDAP